MKISINWVKELLPALEEDAEAIEERLSKSGFEVEASTNLAHQYRSVVVGHVKSAEKHPDADTLTITKVFDGEAERTVVCGAPNVAAGQKVAFAQLGANLPNGMSIERRKIRGIESEGMICSEDELGFSEQHEGIIVLDPKAKPGKPIADVLGLEDVILEVAVTPNRPDALSHYGLARELAALFGVKIKEPKIRLKEAKISAASRAKIEIRERSAKYLGRIVTGVKIGPSPAWVEKRLRAVGQRPISNVVDATNLALLELGHPLHAFDLALLAERRIIVRPANRGETLVTLDAVERKLDPDDLVIADAEKPVALAGVMGGLPTAVSAGTNEILIECALFDPASVRRTARRHALHTEASHRFERGVDPEGTERAVDRCAELIAELAGGTVLKGYASAKKKLAPLPVVGIRPKRAALVLGRAVEAKEVKQTLGALGFESAPKKKGDALRFRAPSWRVDISREEDLIEEVARVAGFDSIPTLMPPMTGSVWTESPTKDPERRVRELFARQGFLETISLAFNARAQLEALGLDQTGAVEVANPLGEESALMRLSLLPSLLRAARHNQDVLPSITDLRMFEIGHTFRWSNPSGKLPVERQRLALLIRGHRLPVSWSTKDEKGNVPKVDAFDVKAAIESVLSEFKISGAKYEPVELGWLHPRSSTRLVHGSEELGVFGELHPDVMARFQLEGTPVFVADLALDAIAKVEGPYARFAQLPRQPPARRDLSFFISKTISADQIVGAIQAAATTAHLEAVEVFDVYEGKDPREPRRSIAVAMTFRAPDRTLTDAEVERAQSGIVAALSGQLGAEIRMA